MVVTLLNKKASYNLAENTDRKKFERAINYRIKNNLTEELKDLYQIMMTKFDELSVEEIKLYNKIKKALFDEQNNEATKPVKSAKANQQPVKISQWQRSGEDLFQKLYIRLLHDLNNYTGTVDLMVTYSAMIMNLFMHMATCTPEANQGASQNREFNSDSCLQYGRSQGNHPLGKFFRTITGSNRSNRLPMNHAQYRLMADEDRKGFETIKIFDSKTGNPKEGKKPNSYSNLEIAHAGLRRNNFAILTQAIAHATKDGGASPSAALQTKLNRAVKK